MPALVDTKLSLQANKNKMLNGLYWKYNNRFPFHRCRHLRSPLTYSRSLLLTCTTTYSLVDAHHVMNAQKCMKTLMTPISSPITHMTNPLIASPIQDPTINPPP